MAASRIIIFNPDETKYLVGKESYFISNIKDISVDMQFFMDTLFSRRIQKIKSPNDKDEINYYYIFKTLRTLFLDLKRKGKNISMIPLDNVHLINNDVNYDESYEKVKQALNEMWWYDRKVFEIINNGESIAEFSRKSYIQYYSLYNTYRKVKDKLKKLL